MPEIESDIQIISKSCNSSNYWNSHRNISEVMVPVDLCICCINLAKMKFFPLLMWCLVDVLVLMGSEKRYTQRWKQPFLLLQNQRKLIENKTNLSVNLIVSVWITHYSAFILITYCCTRRFMVFDFEAMLV